MYYKGQCKKDHIQTKKSESNKKSPWKEETCPDCKGSGDSGDGTCSSCNGKGII